MLDMNIIKFLMNNRTIVLSNRFLDMLTKRGISLSHVKSAIYSSEIIEQYPNDYPYPSVLILGYTNDNKPIHIAISVKEGLACLFAIYYPSLDVWESDFKTRKVRI